MPALFTNSHHRGALLLAAALAFAGCNTTPTREVSQPVAADAVAPAQIQIEESVGFTIVEEWFADDRVRQEYDRAHELLSQGRILDGIEVLDTVATDAPTLSAPRIDMAVAFHGIGRLEEAEAQLNAALAINPSHPVALNELGIIYRKTARFHEARRSYQAALDVYPGFHFARRNLAVLCDLYLADVTCAVENYEAYMATVDSDEEAETWLKNARFRAGDSE